MFFFMRLSYPSALKGTSPASGEEFPPACPNTWGLSVDICTPCRILFHQIQLRLGITRKSLRAFPDSAHALQNFLQALQKILNAV